MTSVIRRLVVSCVAAGLAGAAARGEDPSAEQKYRSALVKAAKAREAAIESARAEYLASLKEQMVEETKKGNLDAAVAVRAKLNGVEAQARAAKSIIRRLAGTTWTTGGGVAFQWADDGTLYHAGRERPCLPLDGQRVVVAGPSGQLEILEFDEKFTKFDQYTARVGDKPAAIGKRAAPR
jgi:hypothetical protein